MRTKLLLAFCLICLRIYANDAISVVAPNGFENMHGQGVLPPFAEAPLRTQAFYGAPEFSTIPEGGLITGVSLRLGDGQGGAVDQTVPKFELRISTTASPTTNPDLILNNNVGADETVVFPAGPLHLKSDYVQGGINSFSLTIPFSSPFFYDPRKGNLLLDFFTYQGANVTTDHGGGDGWVLLGAIDSIEAGISDSSAFPASFTIIPIPEPASFLLLLFAFLPIFKIGSIRRG